MFETLELKPSNFAIDGRSEHTEHTPLAELASQHINLGARYTGIKSWERPHYELELATAADERNVDVAALDPVDNLSDVEEEATKRLSFGLFTESDFDVLRSHLGDIEEFSPEKRKDVLINHFERLTMAGVRFEANAD